MSRIVVLDAEPLGLLSSRPSKKGTVASCYQWLASLRAAKMRVVVPEIADYEVRRELIRAKKTQSVARLDALAAAAEYLPLNTAVMRLAAELWAQARQKGQPTAGDDTIDCDVILAAQALSLNDPTVIVATSNVGHLARFVPADRWENISP